MTRALAAVRRLTPRGGALPIEIWRRRHRGVTLLLWMHVAALPVIGLLSGQHMLEVLPPVALVGLLAIGAEMPRFGVTARSAMTTLGLVSSSAILVYIFDGKTEMHFHYFVVVAVVALYQAWWPYLLALAFVLVEHGLVGTLAPGLVFDMDMSAAHTWATAAVHGGFILAESIACVMFWRVSEEALDREREALGAARDAHRDLERAQELARIGSWSFEVSTDRLTWSGQMFELMGHDPTTFTPTAGAALDMVHADDKGRVAALSMAAMHASQTLDIEYRLVRADGEVRVVHAISEQSLGPNGDSRRTFGTIHDVTERKALQAEIEQLAFHDALTGLANRRLFLDRLEAALAAERTPGITSAVLYLDLDDFKTINDTLGHSVGDELLRVTADRLGASVRAEDTVARLGGDEFAVLLEHVDYRTAHRVADLMATEVRRPMLLEGTILSIRASIGFALAEACSTTDDLMKNADAAMYAVKSRTDSAPGVFPTDPSSR